MTAYRKKLIEVALPLEAINRESAREKSIRHGHPSTLHLWWARRPLAACRAVLFGQLVDDPSSVPEEFKTEKAQVAERERLFRIIEKMVVWKNSNDEGILHEARMEIARSVARGKAIKFNPKMNRHEVLKFLAEHAPPVLDPFCGGGSIPLEAQRLGLRAYGSDLNPVAVLITKALIEIPPKFANKPPVNPEAQKQKKLKGASGWKGAQGLADDVQAYGQWMRNEAEKRIGHFYPKAKLPTDMGGGEATVIAWLWARTVKCPNPACGATMPLVRTFHLSTKVGKETWIQPIVDAKRKTVTYGIGGPPGVPPEPSKTSRGANFRCLVCLADAPDQHIKAEGLAGRMGADLMAIVAEGERGRTYLASTPEQVDAARRAKPAWTPTEQLPHDPRNIWCVNYGLTTYDRLFTQRQLLALTTFSDLVQEVRGRICADAQKSGLPLGEGLEAGGEGAQAYADGVATYLAFAVSRMTDYSSTLATWANNPQMEIVRGTFARQALPMTWDFAEANTLGNSSGNVSILLDWIYKALQLLPAANPGYAVQRDAASMPAFPLVMVSTDPPYYDNISYADLSDFFYVWLRASLGKFYPALCSTLVTPKTVELVASPYRFSGSTDQARKFFETGIGNVFQSITRASAADFPLAIYYAFKQAEDDEEDGTANAASTSSGWETFLVGVLASGLSILGTWPVRSERAGRSISIGTNALATSIVLVCRPRPSNAPIATRQEFVRAMKAELPGALKKLQQGNIAPVDLAQAAIGPGMAVYSRYAKVIEASGSSMPVRTALSLINQVLDEVLAEQESEFDSETRWAIAWFDQNGMAPGLYGDAETLSKAKNTAVAALVEAGFLESKHGKVRLLKRDEMPVEYDPARDGRVTVWEIAQHLIKRVHDEGSEVRAAELAARAGGLAEVAKDLAYRLYTACERKGWSQEAIPYNALVTAWPEISRLAAGSGKKTGLEAFA